MKNIIPKSQINWAWLTVSTSVVLAGLAIAEPASSLIQTHKVIVTADGDGKTAREVTAGRDGSERKIIRIEASSPVQGKSPAKEVAWLGVSTEDAPEVLASQLGLKSGQGLVVIYVAPDSPAAKAGIQKHDVLVELGNQMLVDPIQLRKLVQMQKDGDTVKLALQRNGKKQTVSVTLAKRTEDLGMWQEEGDSGGSPRFQFAFVDGKSGEQVHENLKTLHGTLARAGIDKQTVNVEVQRSMEEVRKAIQEALRESDPAIRATRPVPPVTPTLPAPPARVDIENDATVTVMKDCAAVKSIVKSDEAGVIVIVASPKKHLTAHDKDGKLLFDGEIESPEGQQKVPAGLWEKVRPMLQEIKPADDGGPKPRAQSDDESKS